LGWPSLDTHPIWPAYYAAKEANYAKSAKRTVQEAVPRPLRGAAANPSQRNVNRDPFTHKFVKKQLPSAPAEIGIEAD
jgi:hypothetical protein